MFADYKNLITILVDSTWELASEARGARVFNSCSPIVIDNEVVYVSKKNMRQGGYRSVRADKKSDGDEHAVGTIYSALH